MPNTPSTPNTPNIDETAFEFPCKFALKPLGNDTPEFVAAVKSILEKFVPEADRLDWQQRLSSNGTFLCITITVRATNKEQLDNMYLAFSASEHVKMSL